MERIVHGNLLASGLEVVQRSGRLFLRYDAGAHQVAWREDEISEEEFARLRLGGKKEYWVIINLQKRLEAHGEDPYKQNWTPEKG